MRWHTQLFRSRVLLVDRPEQGARTEGARTWHTRDTNPSQESVQSGRRACCVYGGALHEFGARPKLDWSPRRGEVREGDSRGAQGGSRGLGMREGAGIRVGLNNERVVSGRQACCAWAACWAVRCAQEAARSVVEELMGYSMGAQGASRALGMWEGAAIQVALVYERVVSGGGWWHVL